MLLVSGTSDLQGSIDGVNRAFVASEPVPLEAIVSVNGLSRVPGQTTSNGYVLDGRRVLLGEPLVPGDILTIYWPPKAPAGLPLVVAPGSPRPQAGVATALVPSGSARSWRGAASGTATALRPSIESFQPAPKPGITGTAERT